MSKPKPYTKLEDQIPQDGKKGFNIIPARLVLSLLGFFGYISLYSMRVNFNVAMVAMAGKPQDLDGSNETIVACPELIVHKGNLSSYNKSMVTTTEFDWDIGVQGRVLGSFFYGYFFTQIPGGVLAEKYGAKWIYGCGILITALFSLLTPLAARWSVWALVAVRVIEGLAGGVVYPAMYVMIGRWIPKMERSRATTFMNSGGQVGTVITYAVSGVLCESSFLGGWPSVFYISGVLGIVWFIFWATLAHEYPDVHPRISKRELIYIQENQDKTTHKDVTVPWKSIWTSVPMWALIVTHFGQSWVFYTLLTMMPTYMSNVLHFDLVNDGIVSALPYLMMVFFAIPSSFVADYLRSSGRLHITTIRKLINSIGFFGQGICVLAIAFIGCHPMIIISIFTLSFGINGIVSSGYAVTHIDMSPKFAGTLFGITNGISTIAGFLAPSFVGAILESGQTLRNWGIVYVTTSVVHFVSGIVYDLFASAELQPWNNMPKEEVSKKDSTVSVPSSITSFTSLNP